MDDFQKILGIKFKNIDLLKEALTHRSYLNEDPKVTESNERLEFLGDSVLSVITSTEIFRRFPNFPEGKLTNLRSIIVRTQTLGKVALGMKYGNFLLMSKGEERSGGRENLSLLADTFEAILGAIYLDQGIEVAKNFLEKNLFSQIEAISQDTSVMDYKSKLQEVIQQKTRSAPTYKTINEEGPDHDKIFTVGVFVANKQLASPGRGKSKQEAEQEAARIALSELK